MKIMLVLLCAIVIVLSSGCKTTVGKDPLTGLYTFSVGINGEEAQAAADIGTSVAQSITALEIERDKAQAEIEAAQTDAERQAARERRDAIQAAIDKLTPGVKAVAGELSGDEAIHYENSSGLLTLSP